MILKLKANGKEKHNKMFVFGVHSVYHFYI